MKEHEVKEQMARITQYRALEELRNKLLKAQRALTSEDWKEKGPEGQGPFTGNFRESRQVDYVHLYFTPTRGGAAAVDLRIYELGLEAHELGSFLWEHLCKKIEAVTAEMEKL